MRILTIIFLMLITGCSTKHEDSVTTVNNDSMREPSELDLIQIHVLDSTQVSYPVAVRFDGKGDIYVLEYRSDKIKIFDRETFQLRDSVFAPEKSTISSFTFYDGKLLLNCSGKKKLYILESHNPSNIINTLDATDEIPNRIEIISEGIFFGSFTSNLSGRDDTYIGYDLKMVDSSFTTIKLLNSFFGSYNQGNIDPEIPLFPFAADRKNNSIFVAVSSEKYYKIFAYDFDINLKFIINNKAQRFDFTESEKERLKDLGIKFRLSPFRGEQKTIIESMTTDSEGNLWVRKAHDAEKYGTDTAIIDIFDPEGKYLNTFIVPNLPRIGNFYINENRLFTTSPFDSSIRIYEIDNKKIAGLE